MAERKQLRLKAKAKDNTKAFNEQRITKIQLGGKDYVDKFDENKWLVTDNVRRFL